MTAVFITGTGTDIGKTFVAAGLIRHWRAAGRRVDALKPVATGCDPAEAESSDAGVLLTALGRPVISAEIERISPWRFAAPLSPDMAARREGRSVDFNAVVEFSRKALAANTDTLLIEGIGGIMVPLDREHTVLDWMIALQIPLVVVTGTYLGSLSHTLTCLDVLARRGLAIKALVVNETPDSAVTRQDTSQTLMQLAPNTPIVELQRRAAKPPKDGAFAGLANLLED
jgi:dethiobiotin synthetase